MCGDAAVNTNCFLPSFSAKPASVADSADAADPVDFDSADFDDFDSADFDDKR